jgi:hypothetical protein
LLVISIQRLILLKEQGLVWDTLGDARCEESESKYFLWAQNKTNMVRRLETSRSKISQALAWQHLLMPSRRAMNLGEFIDGKAQQPLPPSLLGQEGELNKFHNYCHDLMLKILTLFAIGLEVSLPYPLY